MDSRVGARHFIPKFMEHLGVTPLHFILENLFYSYKMVSGTTPPVWEHRFVLHGIAQIPVGKAQHLVQNELKFAYSDEDQQRYLCVYMLFCMG